MESQPQNPEFRIYPETFTHLLVNIDLCLFLQEWGLQMDNQSCNSQICMEILLKV